MTIFQNIKLPQKSLLLLICCSGFFVLFLLLSIVPQKVAIRSRKQEIIKLANEIEEKKILLPFYKTLLDIKKNNQGDNFDLPERKFLTVEDLGQVEDAVKKIAQKRDFVISNILMDAGSFSKENDSLVVNMDIHGDFSDLRSFIFEIGQLPYFVSIDWLQVRTVKDLQDIHMRVRLAVDSTP